MPVEGAVSSMTPGPEPHSLRLAEAINFDPNGPGMGLDLDFNNLNFDLGNIDSDVVNTNRDIMLYSGKFPKFPHVPDVLRRSHDLMVSDF